MENRLIKAWLLALIFPIFMFGSCFYGNEISEPISDKSYLQQESVFSDEEVSDISEESDTEQTEEPSEESDIEAVLPDDEELVLISDYIPNIKTDIRYATENNFTGEVIYDTDAAYLRYGTVKKLASVQAELNKSGYELLIWDAYRPTEAQWKLWKICPDANFVSDPNVKYSSHSRGNTVDITVVSLDGGSLEMPSGFDEFGAAADRNYSDVSETAAKNSEMLEEIMEKNGFKGYSKEWWHYSDTDEYPVVEEVKNDQSDIN